MKHLRNSRLFDRNNSHGKVAGSRNPQLSDSAVERDEMKAEEGMSARGRSVPRLGRLVNMQAGR